MPNKLEPGWTHPSCCPGWLGCVGCVDGDLVAVLDLEVGVSILLAETWLHLLLSQGTIAGLSRKLEEVPPVGFLLRSNQIF